MKTILSAISMFSMLILLAGFSFGQQNQFQKFSPPVGSPTYQNPQTANSPPVLQQFPPRIQYQQPAQIQQQQPPQVQYQQPPQTPLVVPTATTLNKRDLRDIDGLVVQLSQYSRQLHDEFHEHLENEPHAAKLDEDVTALEQMADGLHAFATTADGNAASVARLRHDTNEFIQLAVRISRTIDLTEPKLRTANGHGGLSHMRNVARNVTGTALQIDRYLPVDTQVIDNQAERLEAAVKELHDEFHEHLEGYEVSQHLDEDLEEVETLVEHMHELAHNRSWEQIDFGHLLTDIAEVRQKTAHIESLFVRQAQIGVRTSDFIGIDHSRDAITDVLASAYLLEHMIRKTVPDSRTQMAHPVYPDTRPKRDRHGHVIRDPYQQDLLHDHHDPNTSVPQQWDLWGLPQHVQPYGIR